MNKIKKCLAVLVCTAMALAVMPGVALAADGTTADGLEYNVYDDYVEIDRYTGDAADLIIPGEIDGLPVTSIDFNAFSGCTNLTNVTIPNSVTNIGEDAFYGTALYNDSANWENGVLYIGDNLIEANDGISGDYAIRPGTRIIAHYAFNYCVDLTSVTIPDSVTSIGGFAFDYCLGLTDIYVAQDNPSYVDIDGVLFDKARTELIQCPSGNRKTSYEIPDGVTAIDYWAFSHCNNLTSVTIPNSVTSLGIYAFSNCNSLTSVTIGDSVINIGGWTFWNCDSLTDVYYAGSAEEWANIDISNGNDPLLNANIHFNSADSATHEIKVTVNGSKIDFDVPPTAIDGTTMLPVRYALEPLGAEFVWNGENQTVTITAEGKTIVLTIGSAAALVDGVEKTMAQPAMAIDGRTLIPIRFVSEELGYDVQWDGDAYTVIING